jgi:preprotein translocase subunit SecD
MSNRPLLWKLILIVVVAGGAFAFGFPPKDRISLGLDLRGGAHILMQVQTDSSIEYQLNLVRDYLGNGLREKELGYDSVLGTGQNALEIRGTDGSRAAEVREVLQSVVGDWEIVSLGGGNWRVTMPPDQRVYHETAAIDTTLDTMRNRIDALGVAEPLIQKQGIRGDRILVQLPGVEDPERIKRVIGEPAILSWKAVSYPPGVRQTGQWVPPDSVEALMAQFGGVLPDDTEVFVQEYRSDLGGSETTLYWPLKRVSVVSGSDLRTAFRSSGEWGDPAVTFQLTQDAGKRFEAATRENQGRKMAIVLDDKVISAPVIRAVIRDSGIIEGGFTVTSAEDLALKLKSGAFPTKVDIIEERTVGPSLGKDSIRRGLWAGSVGFVGVLLFMVAYYRLSGVNAIVALGLNVILVFGTLGALPFLFSGVTNLRATLTLPGIAGLILTVGMAVDANVLIFERIREELRLGKTVRSAIDQGFGKAFMTILDCNVTTVVAAIFLAMYGTGPVRGFAVTLVIGLAASMFTAIFVSRQIFELVLSRRARVESLSI